MKKISDLQRQIENQAIEWLVKLNNPELSQDEESKFSDWLSTSAAHQAAYIKAEQLWALSPKLVTAESVKWSMKWRYSLASILVVICFSFYQFSMSSTTSYEFYTGIGEHKTVQLKDGSTVILNNQTHFIFTLSHSSRHVELLNGEAYFDVRPDSKRPFDIDTGDGLVRVLGTHFSVNRYGNSTLVTVIEGRVALGEKPELSEKFKAAQVLVSSQQQLMSEALKGEAPKTVDVSAALAWRNQQLIYRGAKLSQVLLDLERVFPVKFQLEPQSLGERQVTAVLNLSSFDQVLSVLTASLQLEAKQSSSVVRLTEK